MNSDKPFEVVPLPSLMLRINWFFSSCSFFFCIWLVYCTCFFSPRCVQEPQLNHLDLSCLLSVYLASCTQSNLLTPALLPTEDWPLDQVQPGSPLPLRIPRLCRRSPFLRGQSLRIATLEKQAVKGPWKPNFKTLPSFSLTLHFPSSSLGDFFFFLSERSFWDNEKEPF